MEQANFSKLRFRFRFLNGETDLLELKMADGRSLGFVINWEATETTLLVAGTGPAIGSVFQSTLSQFDTQALNGRLALVHLDLTESEQASVLCEITALLQPVKDTLFLPMMVTKQANAKIAAFETIENFCSHHELISAQASCFSR